MTDKYWNAHQGHSGAFNMCATAGKVFDGDRIVDGDCYLIPETKELRVYRNEKNQSHYKFKDREHMLWFAKRLVEGADVLFPEFKPVFYLHCRPMALNEVKTKNSWRKFFEALLKGSWNDVGTELGMCLTRWDYNPKEKDPSKFTSHSDYIHREFWDGLAKRANSDKLSNEEKEAFRYSALLEIGRRF